MQGGRPNRNGEVCGHLIHYDMYNIPFIQTAFFFSVPCQMYAAAHKLSWRYLTCIFPGFPFPLFTERLCLESLNSSQLEDIFGIDLPYLRSKFYKSGY